MSNSDNLDALAKSLSFAKRAKGNAEAEYALCRDQMIDALESAGLTSYRAHGITVSHGSFRFYAVKELSADQLSEIRKVYEGWRVSES